LVPNKYAQVSEVERERLGEHVRVMSKKLRGAEEAARESELALREERRRTAHLVSIITVFHNNFQLD
jgi:hypothetical protein